MTKSMNMLHAVLPDEKPGALLHRSAEASGRDVPIIKRLQ